MVRKNMDFRDKKRIVIKLGTSTLTHKTGKLNIRRMNRLVEVISDLYNAGKDIVIVSSGAVGLGLGKLGLNRKNNPDTPTKQAAAAIGQSELMYLYDDLFGRYGITVAQLLLTKVIIETERKKNVENTFMKLLEYGVIPIVNENDTVAIDELELEIGENDYLSALVAKISGADLLMILSDIDGLYDCDPNKSDNAELIPEVTEIEDVEHLAGGTSGAFGKGGMLTKINAAKIATEAGIDVVIMNGKDPLKIYDLLDNKPVGTIFTAN